MQIPFDREGSRAARRRGPTTNPRESFGCARHEDPWGLPRANEHPFLPVPCEGLRAVLLPAAQVDPEPRHLSGIRPTSASCPHPVDYHAGVRCLLLLLLAGCAPQTLPGDIEPLPRNTRVRLAEVYCDYDTWVRVSEDEKKRARIREPEWTGAMAEAFEREAKRIGIWGEGPDSVKVTIALVDTFPGSTVSSAWLGYGSGRAKANADVTLRGHGTFEMGTVIPDDDVNGRLAELGTRIARHIRKRMR